MFVATLYSQPAIYIWLQTLFIQITTYMYDNNTQFRLKLVNLKNSTSINGGPRRWC